MDKEFNQDWQALLSSIGVSPVLWGVQGGNEWISIKQIDEGDFSVQIFTHDGFDIYKKQKDAVVSFMAKKGIVLDSEAEVKDIPCGYWKQLDFISQKHRAIEEKSRQELLGTLKSTQIGTQINGNVNTGGGNVNSGNADVIDESTHSSTSEDKKWFQKEVVKMVLSFIGGVGATLFAQWLMRLLKWIS